MVGYFSKIFFFLWLPLGWRKLPLFRMRVEGSGGTNDGSLPRAPPAPPPSAGSSWRGAGWAAETEAASRCLGSGPCPSPPPPSPGVGLAPWRASAGCQARGGGRASGRQQERAGGRGAGPQSYREAGTRRPHPRTMSAARAPSGAPGRRAGGGRVQWRRRPRSR